MIQQLKRAFTYTLKNTQTRLVLLLTMFVFIIITVVGFTSYHTSKTVLQNELAEPQYQLLQISMNYIDEYIRESDQIAIQVALHSSVYRFLTDEEQNSYDNIANIYEYFTTLINNTPYIDSIYVHDLLRGSFVSIPYGYSSSKLTFADSGWVSIADEFGDAKMLVRKRTVSNGKKQPGSDITLFRKIMIRGEFRGIVAINLNENELFAKLHPPQRSRLERSRFIIDQDGNLLYSAANGPFGDETLQATLPHFPEASTGTIRYNNRSYLVNQLASPVTGWTFISVVSQDSLLEKSQQIRDMLLMVSVAALLLGALVIFYIHSVAFRPVRRMQELFKATREDRDRSDLLHLERVTAELLNNHMQLSQLMRQTIPEASAKFLFDIYSGNIHSKREVLEKWNRYFKDWSDAPLTIALVSIDRYKWWSERFPSTDHSLLKYALGNVAVELLSPEWRSVCADFGKDKLAILLQPARGGPPLKQACENVIAAVNRLFGFSVSIGFSDPQDDVMRLKQAMLEADNALSYRLFRGYGSVIGFQEVCDHEMRSEANKAFDAEELAEAVAAGDEARSLGLVHKLVQEIRDQQWYPSMAISAFKTVEERLRVLEEGQEKEAWFVADSYEEWNTLDLADIGRILKEKTVQLLERYQTLVLSKEYVLCQQMIEFMKKHLGDPIGIEQIAESAGISVSLSSQLFKKEMNDTVYGYLTKLRMDKAGELLIETDDKISDIAGKVGYQHENSFIRVFRKYKGITPGKYREMMKFRKDALNSGMFPAYAGDQG